VTRPSPSVRSCAIPATHRVGDGRRRWLPALGLLLALGSLTATVASVPEKPSSGEAPDGSAETAAPLESRISVQLDILGVGDGTRTVGQRRVVLDVGMSTDETIRVVRRSAGRTVVARCRLKLRTEAGMDGRVLLHLASEVRQGSGEEETSWERSGEAGLMPGTSSMLEIAPEQAPGERLVVSMTVDEAPGERVSATPGRIDLDVAIVGVDDGEEVLLQRPQLRTMAERAAGYAFDFPVPAGSGGGVEHVRFELRITPGFPRSGKVPVRLELTGGFPSPEGPVLVDRDESAVLGLAEVWTQVFRPDSGEGPGIRISVAAFWDTEAFDGAGGSPL